MFEPGERVVCVAATPVCESLGLRVGTEYTVAEVRPAGVWFEDGGGFWLGEPSLQVSELARVDTEEYWGFCAKQFRKVQKRSTETGMSILRGILDGTRKPSKQDS